MKNSLDHLPDAKRLELERVLEILCRAFDEATRSRISPRRRGHILKVVLFGSYARGDWMADRVGGYTPQYDLLVVVSSDELTDLAEYWMDADSCLREAYEVSHYLTAPAHFIVHSFGDVNQQLKRGRPFLVDIIRDGVLLYQSDDAEFARPEKLSPAAGYAEAKENYEEWFASASEFAVHGQFAISRSRPKEAAFMFHQATERLYHCTLLTQTLYSSKSHNLNLLRGQAERVAPELIPAWPRGERFERRSWELLRRAYVEARFSKHYAVNEAELAWLSACIDDLHARVEQSCREYLMAVAV